MNLAAPLREDRASFSLLPGALQGQPAKLAGEGWPNARFLASAARDNKNTRGSELDWEKICFKSAWWFSRFVVVTTVTCIVRMLYANQCILPDKPPPTG